MVTKVGSQILATKFGFVQWVYTKKRFFMREIHRSPLNSPHKDQWHGGLMFSFIRVWTNGWINNRDAGDLRPHRVHYDVIVIIAFQCRRSTYRPGLRILLVCNRLYHRYFNSFDKINKLATLCEITSAWLGSWNIWTIFLYTVVNIAANKYDLWLN